MILVSFFKKLFNKLFKIFNDFIKKVFTDSTQLIIAELKDYAISVVATLKNSDLKNEEKRKEAFKLIKAEAKKRKIKIKDSLVNLIIELAVQYIKNL